MYAPITERAQIITTDTNNIIVDLVRNRQRTKVSCQGRGRIYLMKGVQQAVQPLEQGPLPVSRICLSRNTVAKNYLRLSLPKLLPLSKRQYLQQASQLTLSSTVVGSMTVISTRLTICAVYTILARKSNPTCRQKPIARRGCTQEHAIYPLL